MIGKILRKTERKEREKREKRERKERVTQLFPTVLLLSSSPAYSLLHCFSDWASAIIKAIKYYSDIDIHVSIISCFHNVMTSLFLIPALFRKANCFGKILRNELNEEFR